MCACVCSAGMVNNASIDWYFPWPEQALYAVASVFISPDVSLVYLRLYMTCVAYVDTCKPNIE